ncbi:DoxX family protein [Streptomyces sp. NBC_00091]|uniref:DoxX family protein n=1 Tax=Streptomyces sp. NBC_00091 TaxID=2975648 RepID=UPI00224D2C40|nr:DoxX family protein [Streptomyces sp. NBC_00091]MCX5380301.1 DoxX family protein [Streptomyces sp. NBC_00091]
MLKYAKTGLYWFLALEFALGAVTKWWPGDTMFSTAYSLKFADWGYPSWMRFVVGALEGVAAVLLVIPDRRTRFLAATTLTFVLTGAATTHIVNHDPAVESWAAPTHLVIMGILALANWPADWRNLLPAAAGSIPRSG